MQPSPVQMTYEATTNRGPDAGSVYMSYDIINFPIKRTKERNYSKLHACGHLQ